MSDDDKVFDLAVEVSAIRVQLMNLSARQEENFEETRKIRHELKSENFALNQRFKESVISDYDQLKIRVDSIDGVLKAAGWFGKNWKLISFISIFVFGILTTTTFEFGDKLLNAEPPKSHK